MAQSMVSICLEIGVLNDAKIKAAKPREKPYRLGDSGQLYLQVTPSDGKHWRMNYKFGKNAAGKPIQKALSFCSYPITTLLEARAKRDEAKRLLSQGSDPALERRVAEQARIVARQNTFQAAAEAWFELNSGWSLEAARMGCAALGYSYDFIALKRCQHECRTLEAELGLRQLRTPIQSAQARSQGDIAAPIARARKWEERTGTVPLLDRAAEICDAPDWPPKQIALAALRARISRGQERSRTSRGDYRRRR